MMKKEKEELLSALSGEERKLFGWVLERERRGDWNELRKSVGKPSPRLRIVDHVRELIPDAVRGKD